MIYKSSSIISTIELRIEKFFIGDSSGHDYHHVNRVRCLALELAHKENADLFVVELIALLHDIGDTLASANHADLAATMLQPFVSEENYWIVKHHGIFQGYYFFEHFGLDRNMRDDYRESPYWHACAEFCAKYDQNSFDPDYENMDLEEFEPMVRKVFSQPKNSIYKKRDYA